MVVAPALAHRRARLHPAARDGPARHAALVRARGAPAARRRGADRRVRQRHDRASVPDGAHLGWGFTYAPPGASGATDLLFPTDLDAWLTYDSEKATLDAHVTRGAAEIATVSAEVIAPLERLLADVPARARKARPAPAWTGSFRATLREVPLGEIPLLADSGIAGRVSGEIEMRGLNIAPSLKARLTVPGVTLGNDLAFERGVLALRIDPMREAGRGHLRVTELALEGRRGGKIRANAFASVRFRDGSHPGPRRRAHGPRPLRGALPARGAPAAGRRAAEQGRRDAGRQPPHRARRPVRRRRRNLRAQLQVTDGVVHIPELGQELRDVAARITAEGGVLRIEGFRAAGTTGLAQGWALFRLAGLALRDGAGALTIAEDQALPLTLEGVPLGTASGALSFIAEKKPGELALYVTVPKSPRSASRCRRRAAATSSRSTTTPTSPSRTRSGRRSSGARRTRSATP